MKIFYPILFILLFTFSASIGAQQQNNIWYFGDKAGLDFNYNPPSPITSALTTLEGTASICDPAGQLLFYTNGASVWDRQHNIMPNGNGLLGAASSTQAALIVPQPNSCNLYYLFATEDHYTDGGLTYSVVDMCLNNGLGDIISGQKNLLLRDRTAEKITAVLHTNGTDIWIITHSLNSNQFLAYLLTSTGLNTTPVVSSIGSFYPADGHIGPVKASHRGTRIVSSASFRNICEMFDFDPATGTLSNFNDLKPLFNQQQFVYGLEFSPNDSLLYLSTFYVENNLYQFNLSNNQLTTIHSLPGNYIFGMLQMGPDQKIYMARNDVSFIDVIQQPDRPGTACQYQENGQTLYPGTQCLSGLPNFAPYSFFIPQSSPWSLGNDTLICDGDTLNIQVITTSNCSVNFTWNDGSTDNHKVITQPGTYWLEVQSACQQFRDTLIVTQAPLLNLILQDAFICEGKKLTLNAPLSGVHYMWSTGSTQSFININEPGVYWLAISNACSSAADTFTVTRLNTPTSLVPDTSFCAGDTVTFHLCHAQGTILWSTGSAETSITISKGGSYWVELSNVCFDLHDDFDALAMGPPVITLTDTLLCAGKTVTLDVSQPMSAYVWSDQSVGPTITIAEAGLYRVTVTNECGQDTATISVETTDCDFSVFVPNVFSPNADGINDILKPYASKSIAHYLFEIFDRWGNCVFISTDNSPFWDGTFSGKKCETGVYVYSLDCTTVYGTTRHLQGDITLIR